MKVLKFIINLRMNILKDKSCGEIIKYVLMLILLIIELIISIVLLTASIAKKICSKNVVQKINHFFIGTIPGAIILAVVANVIFTWLNSLLKI